jgi:hypothetical protein
MENSRLDMEHANVMRNIQRKQEDQSKSLAALAEAKAMALANAAAAGIGAGMPPLAIISVPVLGCLFLTHLFFCTDSLVRSLCIISPSPGAAKKRRRWDVGAESSDSSGVDATPVARASSSLDAPTPVRFGDGTRFASIVSQFTASVAHSDFHVSFLLRRLGNPSLEWRPWRR